MQELAPHVYIETAYAGVTLAAINWSHGLILVDAPFRAEDTRSWRSALLNLSGGVDRLLINLDAHFDRTLGTRGMDCTVVGHEKAALVFRNRPVTFKAQGNETGADWELCNGLGSIRWAPPEITFSERMMIHWDNKPLILNTTPARPPAPSGPCCPKHTSPWWATRWSLTSRLSWPARTSMPGSQSWSCSSLPNTAITCSSAGAEAWFPSSRCARRSLSYKRSTSRLKTWPGKMPTRKTPPAWSPV